MSRDTHYEEAPLRWKELMEEASPPCSRNAPGANALKTRIVELQQKQAELARLTRVKQEELNKICRHPTKKRMVRSWTTFDTLGCTDGGYQDVYCTVCGNLLKSNRV